MGDLASAVSRRALSLSWAPVLTEAPQATPAQGGKLERGRIYYEEDPSLAKAVQKPGRTRCEDTLEASG